MSFILDALKKSENERQRQSGPALFEVKVAPPKPRWPAWAFALAALLVINIGVVVWLMMRQPSRDDRVAASQPEAALPVPQMPMPQPVPAPLASAPPLPAPSAPVTSEPEETALPAQAATDDAVAGDIPEPNPDDYAPAVEAPQAGSQVTRGNTEGLPTFDEVSGKPGAGLPELRLDLHVYAGKPHERFIFLNMRRLREGDSLPEGVRVESITPDGAILSFRGSKFVLERD